MQIAVAVQLFIAALVWFLVAFGGKRKDAVAGVLFLLAAAAGVFQLVLPVLGIQIAVAIVVFVQAIASLILMVWLLVEGHHGARGLGNALALGAFLLFAWAVVFGILQLTIVV